ncbi:MAG: histidine--tRNA ligase [Patescibacteria group bacterium]
MKLSTDPYKGVRDFYPEDMARQNQIFEIWKNVAQKYGYQEYNASILEPADLYRAKSGEEIINEQTYTFTDRGDREVTLRPEMTPTVARMVAARKRELGFPLRWFSIPNLFRYEQPQKGRLREHWQLNVDIFGVSSLQAEIEIIQMASDIMSYFVSSQNDYEIRLNHRKLMNYITRDVFELSDELAHKLSKLIDKKKKVPVDIFETGVTEILGEKTEQFITLLNSENFEEFTKNLPQTKEEHAGLKEIREVIASLEKLGITNVRFDQTLMRGFDYYTGIVFEIFDKNPENRRSVFGGGRYDDLLSLFGGDKVPAVGFGAGDVVIADLMETYGKKLTKFSFADIYICVLNEKALGYAQDVAQTLRNKKLRVAIDYSLRKIGDQIKNADKIQIPNIICIGDEEVATGKLKIKNLETGDEKDYI